MIKVLNLVNLSKVEAKKSTSKKNSLLATEAPESTYFLQELTSPVIESVYCFKDVNNPTNGGDITGPFANSRVTKFTLPVGVSYVDYSFDKNKPIFKFGKKGAISTVKKHMILLYDIGALDNAPFHICGDDHSLGTQFEDPQHACIDTLTSTRGSAYKPFHVFQTEKMEILRSYIPKVKITRSVHLVPFAISEGVVVFFIIEGTKMDQEATLQALLVEILRTQSDNSSPSHWFINSNITYQDSYGIFTCTAIKSINGIQFGNPN